MADTRRLSRVIVTALAGACMFGGVAGLTCPTTIGTGCYVPETCQTLIQTSPPPYCWCQRCPEGLRFPNGNETTPGSKYNSAVVQSKPWEERRRFLYEGAECSFDFCMSGELVQSDYMAVITGVTAGNPCTQPW